MHVVLVPISLRYVNEMRKRPCTDVHTAGTSLHARDDDMYTAASMYYIQGETMETIARQLDVSRSTVSRLIQEARRTGIVRISLAEPHGSSSRVAQKIEAIFDVRCHVAPVKDGVSEVARLDRVASIAAQLLTSLVHDRSTIGVAWGTTMAAVASHLSPIQAHGVRIVQLNGAANSSTSGIPYAGEIMSKFAQSFGGEVISFPVPAFFDYPETKQVMWRERSVQRVHAIQQQIDVAIFGVGAFNGPVASHVYSAGYLDDPDFAQLHKEGAVGDVCTVFLRADGSVSGISLNKRATGMRPSELARLPKRICVAAGEFRVPGIIAALRSGAVTDLVIDEGTAKSILRAIQAH